MDAIELLTTTKAVRRRIDFDRPVPFPVLEDCVRVAVRRTHDTFRWHGDQMSKMPALVIVGLKEPNAHCHSWPPSHAQSLQRRHIW